MVIGISGKIGTGKSKVARYLEETGFMRRSFADAVREEVAEVLGLPFAYTYEKQMPLHHLEPPFPRPTMTVREALQFWGTEYRRFEDPHYWVRRVAEWYRERPGVDVVIDDCRFPDEADWVHSVGGLFVRLLPYPGWTPGPNAGHVSETALDDYPRVHIARSPAYGSLRAFAAEILEAARAHALTVKHT